jgi:hypothetical protein
MTAEQIVTRLRADVPEFAEAIDQHFVDNDELLLHLLLGDLSRACVTAWRQNDSEFNRRVLALLEEAFGEGEDDDYVSNAVSVSFVEDVGPWDPAVAEFIAGWPPRLLQDARRAGYRD